MGTNLVLLKLLLHPTWAAGDSKVNDYENLFAETIVEDKSVPALAFGKGRVALWSIIRSLGLETKSQVLLPAYTCETVPMALKYAGIKCIYVDVEPHQFNASIQGYSDSITSDTRAIICQHTYGIAQPIGQFLELAEKNNTALIEDCCHLAAPNFNRNNGAVKEHAAFFSTHHNKLFSTGHGGMAVFPDNSLHNTAKAIRDGIPNSYSRSRAISFCLHMLAYEFFVKPKTRALIGSIYRYAQRAGLIRGSISVAEYEEIMPTYYLSKVSNCQALLGTKQLQRWSQNVRHRHILTRFYIEQLSMLGMDTIPLKKDSDDPILLYVPLLVENKSELLKRAMLKGVPIACWFDRMPAHICSNSAYRYDYQPGQCPWAEKLMSQEIHLLTAPWVTLRQAEKAIKLIKQQARIVAY